MVPSSSSSHKTEVYNPKTVFPHAASLHQSSLHCAISPTAASRRSLGRISVPMWPFNLSVRLLIIGLVCRYHSNYLISREPICRRSFLPFISIGCPINTLYGITISFPMLSPSYSQVAHVLLTRPPLSYIKQAQYTTVRLACVRRAASVRPEPGSNSLFIINRKLFSLSLLELSRFRFPFRITFLFLTFLSSLTRVCFSYSLLFIFQCSLSSPSRRLFYFNIPLTLMSIPFLTLFV